MDPVLLTVGLKGVGMLLAIAGGIAVVRPECRVRPVRAHSTPAQARGVLAEEHAPGVEHRECSERREGLDRDFLAPVQQRGQEGPAAAFRETLLQRP